MKYRNPEPPPAPAPVVTVACFAGQVRLTVEGQNRRGELFRLAPYRLGNGGAWERVGGGVLLNRAELSELTDQLCDALDG